VVELVTLRDREAVLLPLVDTSAAAEKKLSGEVSRPVCILA
jgi:hypothetical protein